MQIIIVDQKHGESKSLVLKGWLRLVLCICLLGLPVLLGYYSYQFAAAKNPTLDSDTALAWAEQLKVQEQEVQNIRQEAEAQLQALTLQMAHLQARLLRLDALGERLTSISDLDDGEFDFSQPPAVGGPASPESINFPSYEAPDLHQALNQLTNQIENRQQQLELLDSLISGRQTQAEAFVAGRPIDKGWISSPFGRRIDPFTGEMAWHQGVDFATGKKGVEIKAVAAGVVTWADEKYGYGLMVQLNHGNGYETLYAHDQEVLVKPGDVVKKGQVIALSGSSGRTTGPHVHFEVHKHGLVIDPATYIHRASR